LELTTRIRYFKTMGKCDSIRDISLMFDVHQQYEIGGKDDVFDFSQIHRIDSDVFHINHPGYERGDYAGA